MPIPRFSVAPEILCEGSTGQAIDVDGRNSLGRDAMPSDLLTYRWSILPPPLRWVEGGPEEPAASAEVDVAGPISVTLTLTDETGGTARHTRLISVTRTTPTPCGSGCAEGEVCVQVGGEEQCVVDLACSDDQVCGPCLICRQDSAGVGRCVGPP